MWLEETFGSMMSIMMNKLNRILIIFFVVFVSVGMARALDLQPSRAC
jgi:hypothetical protein